MDYISVREASARWGISERRVQKLCENKRIEGVLRFGYSWMIPQNAEKPDDLRRREAWELSVQQEERAPDPRNRFQLETSH